MNEIERNLDEAFRETSGTTGALVLMLVSRRLKKDRVSYLVSRLEAAIRALRRLEDNL